MGACYLPKQKPKIWRAPSIPQWMQYLKNNFGMPREFLRFEDNLGGGVPKNWNKEQRRLANKCFECGKRFVLRQLDLKPSDDRPSNIFRRDLEILCLKDPCRLERQWVYTTQATRSTPYKKGLCSSSGRNSFEMGGVCSDSLSFMNTQKI